MTQTETKRTNNFLLQGSILAIAGIIVRIIGMVYRIPLTQIIGDVGNGYYSAAYNIYTIVLLVSSYSLPLAVSKLVSSRITDAGFSSVRKIFIAAMFYATVVGFLGFALLWFGADFLSSTVFKMAFAKYAIKSLAPTVWIMAYLGVLRGYYQGRATMIPTAISQVFEQVVNALVSIGAAVFLMKLSTGRKSYALGAAGGTIGTGAGALAALSLLILFFVLENKKRKSNEKQNDISYIEITKLLIITVLPVILSTAVYNISGILDTTVYGQFMANADAEDAAAIGLGIYSTKYKLLINIPVAMANALSSSLIPALSHATAARNKGQVVKNVSTSIRFSMIIAIPAAIGLAILAEPILMLLFRSKGEAVTMLHIGSAAVIFYSLSTVSNAILQGINHMRIPVRHAAISLVIHLLLLILLLMIIPNGIYALVLADMIFAICMCVLNALAIRRYLNYKQELRQTYIIPGMCAIIMGVVCFAAYKGLGILTSSSLILTIIPTALAVIVYAALLLKLGGISEIELKGFPKGRSLVLVAKKLKLL